MARNSGVWRRRLMPSATIIAVEFGIGRWDGVEWRDGSPLVLHAVLERLLFALPLLRGVFAIRIAFLLLVEPGLVVAHDLVGRQRGAGRAEQHDREENTDDEDSIFHGADRGGDG